MSNRELVVLGTASQAPTRTRSHNGYLLRWDGEGLLFDPGEGTQRQLLFAGARASEITRICITHFHGDHCLGLPGVLQRMSLDRVAHPVGACYPAEGRDVFWRLRHAALFDDVTRLRELPLTGEAAVVAGAPPFRLTARRLSHRVPAFGYQLAEPERRRMLPDRLAAHGVAGPDVGRLLRQGHLDTGGGRVMLSEVSEPRRGQRFAFIMDTRLCEAAFALADGADMVVCESTFLQSHEALAAEYGHLTARQAGQLAAAGGARLLVLSHFSQRYEKSGGQPFAREAAEAFSGEIVAADDLSVIAVPPR